MHVGRGLHAQEAVLAAVGINGGVHERVVARALQARLMEGGEGTTRQIGLTTILPLRMLYVEWQNRGARRGETIYCAMVIVKYNGGGCNKGAVECQE